MLPAGRYAEAADNYSALNLMFEKRDYELSLDNIGQYLLPKMKANVLAGRKDSALATGMKIIECFDSALTSQKKDAAAELATVYDTKGKVQLAGSGVLEDEDFEPVLNSLLK